MQKSGFLTTRLISPLNKGFFAFEVDIISMKKHNCHRRFDDVTSFHKKCYVMCGHNIIYDMTLSTEKQQRHMINDANVRQSFESNIYYVKFIFKITMNL